MSCIPKNLIFEDNVINVEYNGYIWNYKGSIVTLIKNSNKIVWQYNITSNLLSLNYDDGEEKFSFFLNLEKTVDTSEKKSVEIMIKEILEKAKEIKVNNKKILDLQNIMTNSKKKIDELNKEIVEYNNEINIIPLLIKYENGMPLTFKEKFELLIKKKLCSMI